MAHVSEAKKQTVEEFKTLLEEFPIVGAVNLEGLPAPQLQTMRAILRDKGVVLKMSKRRLLTLAIEGSKDKKKGIEKLEQYLGGMPALLFTKESPFKLFKSLQKSKSSAPAKAGQIAPKDIIVPAGPTGFAPGPVISELGGIGIKAGIADGKVIIKEDSLVVKEGDEISVAVASILTRIKIEPMEIGLDLVAAYEAGIIYPKKILNVNEEEYIINIETAARWSFNLAMETGIMTKETTEVMIQKAFSEAKAIAISQSIMADAVINDIIAKAQAEMLSVASQLPDEAKPDQLKGVSAPTAPAPSEEKKDDDKEPEKPKEEAAAGLGALFG